jgi:hypothetical protein
MNLKGIDTSDLTDDGDLLELGDRFRLRLRIEHDPDSSINDYDGDGKVSKYAYDHRDAEYRHRPDGFTGRARKFEVDRGLVMWWEPYDGPMGWQDDAGEWHHANWDQLPVAVQRKEAERIHDLLMDGFKVVSLMLEELVPDSWGGEHWVEAGFESLGGVDSFYPELISDLASELPDVMLNT